MALGLCGPFVCRTRISEAFSRSIMPKEGRGEDAAAAVAEIYCDPLKADCDGKEGWGRQAGRGRKEEEEKCLSLEQIELAEAASFP